MSANKNDQARINRVSEAVMCFYLREGRGATRADIAAECGKSLRWVGFQINKADGLPPGCSLVRLEKPVLDRNYGTVVRHVLVDTYVPLRSRLLHFTPTEWEILQHRLDVPDAIVEALTDTPSGCLEMCADPQVGFDLIPAVVVEEHVDALGATDPFDDGRYYVSTGPINRVILEDCVEGSTFFAGLQAALADKAISTGYYASRVKAARSIETKLGVSFPDL